MTSTLLKRAKWRQLQPVADPAHTRAFDVRPNPFIFVSKRRHGENKAAQAFLSDTYPGYHRSGLQTDNPPVPEHAFCYPEHAARASSSGGKHVVFGFRKKISDGFTSYFRLQNQPKCK